eukprot:CAMPEP_0204841914 /NCGR_PEP_ID=MMETSP1346-20131115/44108_1 /ASSEMBLY_ACC=CAM_ASM_000771 /TAXON_ID=215587 /ORGANISM="Aplanochytrium stocchinoi, Strain GSBS06" /LENGTH=683 /DNA_ID=CAMNT_0051980399 /DNA_START=81 /DNA_END=2132 /DNA_ORIENTATION=-
MSEVLNEVEPIKVDLKELRKSVGEKENGKGNNNLKMKAELVSNLKPSRNDISIEKNKNGGVKKELRTGSKPKPQLLPLYPAPDRGSKGIGMGVPPPFLCMPPPIAGLVPNEKSYGFTKHMQTMQRFHMQMQKLEENKNKNGNEVTNQGLEIFSKQEQNYSIDAKISPLAFPSTLPTPGNILESKQSKKQRRLIRNRMSAQLHRERKKQHLGQLENRVKLLEKENDELDNENKNLKERVEELNKQNERFKEEINKLLASSNTKARTESFSDIIGADIDCIVDEGNKEVDIALNSLLMESYKGDSNNNSSRNKLVDIMDFNQTEDCSYVDETSGSGLGLIGEYDYDISSEELLSSSSPSSTSCSSDTDDSSRNCISFASLDDSEIGSKSNNSRKRRRRNHSQEAHGMKSRFQSRSAAACFASIVFVVSLFKLGDVSLTVSQNSRSHPSAHLDLDRRSLLDYNPYDYEDINSTSINNSGTRGMQLALAKQRTNKTAEKSTINEERFNHLLWNEIGTLTKMLPSPSLSQSQSQHKTKNHVTPTGLESRSEYINSDKSVTLYDYIDLQESIIMCPSAHGMLWDGLFDKDNTHPSSFKNESRYAVKGRQKDTRSGPSARKLKNKGKYNYKGEREKERERENGKFKNHTKVVAASDLPHLTLVVPYTRNSEQSFVQLGCRVESITELLKN